MQGTTVSAPKGRGRGRESAEGSVCDSCSFEGAAADASAPLTASAGILGSLWVLLGLTSLLGLAGA